MKYGFLGNINAALSPEETDETALESPHTDQFCTLQATLLKT